MVRRKIEMINEAEGREVNQKVVCSMLLCTGAAQE